MKSSSLLRTICQFPQLLSFHAGRVLAFAALVVGASVAHAVVPMLMNGSADIANYTNTPWTLQKTGAFVPGANAGVGTVNWNVNVVRGTSSSTLAAIGYIDLINSTPQAVPIESVVINLQKLVAGDWSTITSDVADSTSGDAATQAAVDPDITYEGASLFQENAFSDTLKLTDSSNAPFVLNSPPRSVAAGQTLRIYFVANFKATVLNLAPGTSLQIETIVSFGGGFIMPSLSTLNSVTVPTPTLANDSVTLLDSTITTSGTVTVGPFTGLNQVLNQSAAPNVGVSADGGTAGGTACNTATLTSPATTIPIVVNNVTIPLIVIPGVDLSATDCQDIPKKPGGPKLIVSTVNSCSQVVTYDTSLFQSDSGTIVTASFNPASGSTFPFGTSTVDYSVTDSAGNSATGTFTVNVIDSEAPVIAPVTNITKPTDSGKCTAVVSYSTTATDCNLQSLTFSPASGSEFPIGTSTVTITATDTAGHSSTSTFTVTVQDVTAPVLHTSNVVVNATAGTCGANVSFAATADDCSAVTFIYSLSPTFSPTISSGANFPVGTTTVYVKATDAAGNVSTGSFTVTVKDTQPPAITSPLVNLTLQNDTDQCYATFVYTPAAIDNCGGAVTVTVSPASGSHFAGGTTTTVTVTATDSAGNITTGTFTVTVAQCPGKLGNYVWHDVNTNGVQDLGEVGIDGVKVTLFTAAGVQVGSTTTSGGGYYLFTNLTPGDYYVIFDKTTLPAGFVFTSQNVGGDTTDSDANPTTGKSEGNATVTAGGYNDTVDAGAYLPKPPGLKIEKTASPTVVQPYQPVTYTYTVTNTGGTALTNIVVKDDNGTPGYPGDDFVVGTIASLAPGASATLTAQIIPVVSTYAVVNGNTVTAGSVIVVTLPNGDIKATYLQSFNVNDNTYGTGQIGWPGGNKKFAQLVTSDHLEFRFLDKNKKVIIDFYVDYVSATSSVTVPGTGQVISYPSGYGTMGPFGGDGYMVAGSASNVVSFSTSITDNLNRPANVPYKSGLTLNSPTSLVSGNVVIDLTKAPGGWDPINSYTVVIKGSAFGSAGFGSVLIPDQHNSPSKLGVEALCTKTGNSTVINTATATSGSLTATDTATVYIGTPPPPSSTGSIGSLVWIDKDGDGIQDAGEPGLGGVTVQLKNSSGVVIATDVTDGMGVYGFDGLSAGTYTVVVGTPSGYTPSPKAVGSDRAIDSNGSPATVTLATNSSVDLTIDFGFVPAQTCSKPLLTYTQGGWGADPKGNNPGALLSKKFSTVYPSGYVYIGTSSRYIKFTSAKAIAAFLPQGGTPGVLSGSATNPTSTSAGVLAGQLLALRLNVDFSATGQTATGLGGKRAASGPLAGKTVNEILGIANSVIAGGALPSGLTLSSLNDVLTAINENYDNGTSNDGYLY